MAYQRYSIVEALNRFFRLWSGNDPPSDVPNTLPGEVLSEDEAWSKIAELMAGSLPGETLQLPSSLTVAESNLPDATTSQKGIAELATDAEVIVGTDTERIVTPAGLAAHALFIEAHEFGEIYTSTGTVTMSVGTAEVKITGSFQTNGLDSDNVANDQANDRIVINNVGTYFVPFGLSFSGAASTTFTIRVFLDGVAQTQITAVRKLGAGGDVGSCSAQGLIVVTGTNMAVDVRVVADGSSKNFMLEAGQLLVEKTPA